MSAHTLDLADARFARVLHRRMRQAQWSAWSLIASTLLFLLFLEELWRHPYEQLWCAALVALTGHLLYTQWRMAEMRCPHCGGSWTAGLWTLPHPFRTHHPACRQCGFSPDSRQD